MGLSDILGDQIDDPDEEHFFLFSSAIPSSNLGFLSNTSATLEVTVGSDNLTIHQSPGLLSSNAASGTTGAVLWKITPLVAEWLLEPGNFLFKDGFLRSDGSRKDEASPVQVLELGCGISGVIALALRRRVARYVATDLDYVLKGVRRNLVDNGAWAEEDAHVNEGRVASGKEKRAKSTRKSSARSGKSAKAKADGVVEVVDYDWTTTSTQLLKARIGDAESTDVVLACDCIYNEALVAPFVEACVDASSLGSTPPLCIVAQQLRSDLVFEAWIKAFSLHFDTWRVPDRLLNPGLREGSGYVIHIGKLKTHEPEINR